MTGEWWGLAGIPSGTCGTCGNEGEYTYLQ